ncbi:CRISPR system precrRNA processing endoribonuclease RAMP protein Cas6 [Sphaerotilus uruguayifluvii]|uniref:CRISPR-associated protein Cas6 C-terminal domain-containing protein n=1 Tax=Sphaerotilus uruguayifluvii TaxID=2735897 RepID=A0ABX2G6U1_9BURK|nr:CRISPR system precrRNA processing endoribonuclease RAMP protein Cas6 [Leptothrix sp. C29]NRT58051.1 hypothetical protein [Leptothrix sp. C29]
MILVPMSSSLPLLPITRYRFTAVFETDLTLPDHAGSLLRGVFGAALRREACMTGLPACGRCPLLRTCPYPSLFEMPPPPLDESAPIRQRFSQVPNPYVIEPPPPDVRERVAGEPLVWNMVLIGEPALCQLPLIVHAWQRALRDGLGPRRCAGVLIDVEAMDLPEGPLSVFDPETAQVRPHAPMLRLPTLPVAPDDTALTVQLHLLTPLRLQHQGQPLGPDRLDVRTLLGQMLRRTTLMMDLHLGVRPVPYDAPALLARLSDVHDDRSGLRWRKWSRYSARQRQEMNLGGVTGIWTLHGGSSLRPFLPWLHLGQWLHLGKNATMGLGAYRLEVTEAH